MSSTIIKGGRPGQVDTVAFQAFDTVERIGQSRLDEFQHPESRDPIRSEPVWPGAATTRVRSDVKVIAVIA